MSITGRQNNLFLAEDWKKIYQTFNNSDFSSYDFENLRRVLIQYLRQNYPEDFNDYIESSEYLALIDLIAYLGQNLSFRMDLNARENFLELAERRESVLRLAQLISYNPKRTIPANGLLKIDSIATTEEVIDSSGRNLSNIEVSWNDVTNNNWFDQFTKILNSAMVDENNFGVPQSFQSINDIYTEQYRLNSKVQDLPVFSYTKTIDGRSGLFELVSTIIENSSIVEDPPNTNSKISLLYRDDAKGFSSNNTGWFMHFRQGSLNRRDFTITTPNPNEIVNVDDANINEQDVWLYSLNQRGEEDVLWTKVPAVTGNNIIYNSIEKTIKNIYKVQTRANDAISLVFADGVFGNLPKGQFRLYYRTSNGLNYTVSPKDMRGIIVNIPYLSKKSEKIQNLRITLSLRSTVSNAVASETNNEIKVRAPATYYTQNRMITGEDYNLAPLGVSQSIAKVKTVNRTSSGISRNFDLIDASGKYSAVNVFCTDGIIYREDIQNTFDFSFNSRTEIELAIKNKIEPIIKTSLVRDFYYEKYNKVILTDINPIFKQVTTGYNETTGYISDPFDNLPFKVSNFTGSSLKYIEPGALIKFVPPEGFYFTESGALTNIKNTTTTDRIWAKVISVIGDGSASGTGILPTGLGPLVFNQKIPNNAILQQIIPKFVSNLPNDLELLLIDLIFNFRNFGLRYDISTRRWQIIQDRNLNLLSSWSNSRAGDNTGQKLDSSWLIAFETDGQKYKVTYRGLEYYFESIKENRFFFDGSKKIYDTTTGKIQKDKVSVLKFNTKPNSAETLGTDYTFEIVGTSIEEDGYASSKAVKITFSDTDNDGVIDNPDSFNLIVNSNLTNPNRFVFFEKYITNNYTEDYRYIENTNGKFVILANENLVTNLTSYDDGQLFYFYDIDVVKKLDKTNAKLNITKDFFANVGRNSINFHYLHNADSSYRIDPSASNIMDTYILTKSYDNDYRRWIKGFIDNEPLPPSTLELKLTYGRDLDKIKSISDEIVFHPVKYKVLFGDKADTRLQATFKVVKNKEQVITDNDIKSRIIQSINEFFAIDNWDFGDTFYFSELSAYVMNKLSPFITTFLIIPDNNDQSYGSLQQISSAPNEVFINGATVNDIHIIDAITANKIKSEGYILTSTLPDVNSTNLRSSNINS
jgi:hypothetical protein